MPGQCGAEDLRRCYESEPADVEGLPAGVPEGHGRMGTLGDLVGAGYAPLPAREQVRRNLLSARRRGLDVYRGIIGFGGDVVPALDRALLAGHDVLLVGQVGQAKTRLAMTVARELLSPMPVVRGSVTNDCPMDLPMEDLAALMRGDDPREGAPAGPPAFHISPESAGTIREMGPGTPVEWRDGLSRYRYVLATPDTSVKDLVGYVDAIRVARRGIEAHRIDSYSPGKLMQAKHGVLCIDELPVLDPRKQVSLLSVLQEGTFTTGPYPVAFEPRALIFATANPVDYTHSGRVIEPLLDRLRSHVRTRYPRSVRDEMMIMLQEARLPEGTAVAEPVLRLLASVLASMRASAQVDQQRGVSTRLGIHGLEVLAGEALRTRPARAGGPPHGPPAVPRPSDLRALGQVAKFELSELDDTPKNRDAVFCGAVDEALKGAALDLLGDPGSGVLASVRAEFSGAGPFTVSQEAAWGGGGEGSYGAQAERYPSLLGLIEEGARAAGALQKELRGGAASLGMANASMVAAPGSDGLLSAVAEMLLEALRWTRPRTLDRRDAGYAAA